MQGAGKTFRFESLRPHPASRILRRGVDRVIRGSKRLSAAPGTDRDRGSRHRSGRQARARGAWLCSPHGDAGPAACSAATRPPSAGRICGCAPASAVLIHMGSFPATDFGALFDGTAALAWERVAAARRGVSRARPLASVAAFERAGLPADREAGDRQAAAERPSRGGICRRRGRGARSRSACATTWPR